MLVRPGVASSASSHAASRGWLLVLEARRRRSGSAPCPRSASRRPSSFRRTCTILRSTARHRLERHLLAGSNARARPCGSASVVERRLSAGRGTRQRRRRPACARQLGAEMIALTRYWRASMVWPWRPIRRPRSPPVSVAVHGLVVLADGEPRRRAPARPRPPRAPRARATDDRAGGLLLDVVQPGDHARGEYPTPSRPRSPSETTWKRTRPLSRPGAAARARAPPPTSPRRRSRPSLRPPLVLRQVVPASSWVAAPSERPHRPQGRLPTFSRPRVALAPRA